MEGNEHVYTVVLTDNLDNTTEQTVTLNEINLYDVTPQLRLADETLGNGQTTNPGLFITADFDENSTVQYSTDGGQSWSDDYQPVFGSNTVQVRITDNNGNTSESSQSITFSYLETPPDGRIDVSNYNSTDKGFTLTGQTYEYSNGQKVTIIDVGVSHYSSGNSSGPQGFGAAAKTSDADRAETGYDHSSRTYEQLIATFDHPVISANVKFDWHGDGESATYQLLRNGVVVGSGETGERDIDPIVKNITADNGGTFDQIVFSVKGNAQDTNNDYLIKYIDYKLADLTNYVRGDAENNILSGGAEDSIFEGNQGDDLMIGGGGSDKFVFELSDLLTSTSTSIQTDIISDFTKGTFGTDSEADALDLSGLLIADNTSDIEAFISSVTTEGLTAALDSTNNRTVLTFDSSANTQLQTLNIYLDGVTDLGNSSDDILRELVNNGQIIV